MTAYCYIVTMDFQQKMGGNEITWEVNGLFCHKQNLGLTTISKVYQSFRSLSYGSFK